MTRCWKLTLAICLGVFLAACDDGDGSDGTAAGNPLADGELSIVEPGGDTICSRGTPFRFFAVGGAPDKVIIDFQGGGACWNDWTCSVADAIFSPEAPSAETIEGWAGESGVPGLYQLDDADNPLAGWTLLHIPYCTGDVHWGNATTNYGADLEIHHRGYANVTAALDWLQERYPAPKEVFVTGCSAGAYGAIGHASNIVERFPDAKVSTLADSGAGIITDSFFADSFPNWNAFDALPTSLADVAMDELDTLSITDLYVAVADAFPEMRIAQQNAAYDRDQIFFYTTMGGPNDWNARMRDNLATIEAAADNFSYYTAPGQVHCIHPYDIFYTRASGPTGGDPVLYRDWLAEFVSGSELPAPVTCDAQSCLVDPICDACDAAGNTDGECRWCSGWDDRRTREGAGG